MNTTLRLCPFLLTLFLLSACGQKGPLFLPGNPDEVRSEVPTTNSPADIDEDEDADEDQQQY